MGDIQLTWGSRPTRHRVDAASTDKPRCELALSLLLVLSVRKNLHFVVSDTLELELVHLLGLGDMNIYAFRVPGRNRTLKAKFQVPAEPQIGVRVISNSNTLKYIHVANV